MTKTYTYGQKISHKYAGPGTFRLQTSDNISALNVSGLDAANSIKRQLATVDNVGLSVSVLRPSCFSGCVALNRVSLETSMVSDIGENCFQGCVRLKSVVLSKCLSQLSRGVFGQCESLSSVTFPLFESDDLIAELSSADLLKARTDSARGSSGYGLSAICDGFASGCDSLAAIAIPRSISSVQQISKNSMSGAKLEYVSLLGVQSDAIDLSSVERTNCFGLGRNCQLETSDGKIISYIDGKAGLSAAPYDVQSVLKIGKREKMRLGKIYKFNRSLIEWCMSEKVPFMTAYFDNKTSMLSRTFVKNVLFDENLNKKLKSRDFFIFALDRAGMVFPEEGDSDLSYYRNEYSSLAKSRGREIDGDFVALSFFYNENCESINCQPKDTDEFLRLVDEHALKTKFNEWDASKYKVKIDVPDPETVPDGKIDASNVKSWGLPLWYNNGSITPGTSWTPSGECVDFKVVATPDTTYCLICAYDERNPTQPPVNAINGVKSMFEKHSNYVDCYYKDQEGSAEVFLNGLKKGITYHYFMFFEFSHGQNYYITLPGGVTRDDVWNAIKDAKNRLVGMFDSCDSGSMINTVKSAHFQASKNITLGEFLVNKFKEQRDQRLRKRMSLMKAGSTADDIAAEVAADEPAIWMWSSTAKDHYGWYSPTRDTVFGAALRQAYQQCASKRNSDMWASTKEYGTCNIGEGKKECIPQQAAYGADFTKNMTFT